MWLGLSRSGDVPRAYAVSAQASGRPAWRCQTRRMTRTSSGSGAGSDSGNSKAHSDADSRAADSLSSSGCGYSSACWTSLRVTRMRYPAALSKVQAPL